MSGSERTVLLSYNQKNKKVVIPASSPKSDLDFLRAFFLTTFKFEWNSNVSLDVTLQRYDREFDEYVDLEDSDSVNHMDKLKVVVTPIMDTHTPGSTSSAVQSEIESCDVWTPVAANASLITHPRTPMLDESEDHTSSNPSASSESIVDISDDSSPAPTPLTQKRKMSPVPVADGSDMQLQATGSSSTQQYRLFKPAKFIKTEEDKIPLPDPFELPKNYRPDVMQALESKQMTVETTSSFYSTIAGSMFTYKRYLTSDDLTNVARVIVQKYPFMKSPTGKPYDAITVALQNRFKEFRRDRKKIRESKSTCKSVSTTSISKSKLKCPSKGDYLTPPPGEDNVSFERHNRVLKAEFSKSKPNTRVVQDLMERTYALRRNDILSQGHSYDPLMKYPFLQVKEHLFAELRRIVGSDILAASKTVWSNYSPKIIAQSKLERGSKIAKMVTELVTESDAASPLVPLCLLCYLLPESRCKADHTKIIITCDVSDDVTEIVRDLQSHPYIMAVGTIQDPQQAFLVVDKKILMEVQDIQIVPLYLLAAFYVFNTYICYPVGCSNIYRFLEVTMLGLKECQIPLTVANLLAHLA